MAERTRPIRMNSVSPSRSGGSSKARWRSSVPKTWAHIFARMAIDGYIINVDYTQQKKLAAAVSRAASNINQICRRIQQHRAFLC